MFAIKPKESLSIFLTFMIVLMNGCDKPKPDLPKEQNIFSSHAFVCLNKAQLSASEQIEKALNDNLKSLGVKSTNLSMKEKEAFSFEVEECKVVVVLADYPVPWQELEPICKVAPNFENATEILKGHKAHIIVLATSTKGTKIEQMLVLTKVIASLLETHDSAGVYYGNAGLVISPEYYIESARRAQEGHYPIDLWIFFDLFREDKNSFTLVTDGLTDFNNKEIEIVRSQKDPKDIYYQAMGTAWMILDGKVIIDGDTVGPNETTKYKVTYENSICDRPGKVFRIHMK